jgi:hypothetical protein
MLAPKRVLPSALAANIWKPGRSGNPTGNSGLYGETVRLARQPAPDAIRRLIELMRSEDERVAAAACNSILDRALGKPRPVEEERKDMESRLAAMTRAQRLRYMRELLNSLNDFLPAAQKRRRLS